MSLFSRLFGKSPPAAEPPATRERVAGIESPPTPDPSIRAREEEASLSLAIVAGDMAVIGKWVLDGSSTRIRQMAARNVTDPDQLRELIPVTRHGKDKNVHRILTSRRDELLAEIRNTQQLQSDLEEAATAIARHSGRPFDASYPTTLAQLEARWCTLAPQAPPNLRSEVMQHLQRAHEVVVHHRQALEAETERQRSAAVAAAEARRQRELEAQTAAAAAAEQARIRDAERQALREAEQAQRAADEAKAHEILGLLRQARAALDHGGTARAARLRASITEKLADAPALPAWFARQLEQVDSRLAELQDWKTFRVVPKRAELVQRMQSLVGADLAPGELAQQIRQLRDEWRTLNRGAGEDPADELQQFQDAAGRAYEPCREHFARQAELRKENQERREALIERLANFAAEQAGEHPNWRSINQAIVESRREWRQHAPVDQAIVKPLQARFHALVGELQARLDAEYARNVQIKRDLIARTTEPLNLEDTRWATDETKNLQRTWKSVGIVPWNLDNALWDEFRQRCDAVFQRSSQESAAYAVTLEANEAQATGVCEELERIAGLTDESLLTAVPQLDELCAKFESLDLPRASARALQQRYSHATDRCAEAVRRHRAKAARRGWTDGFTAAARVRAYALATVQGRSPPECEALRASATSAIADLAHAPKAMRSILEQRLAAVAAGTVNLDVAANEAALRLLCIRAELISGASTPPEDLELRREYQMRRLVETMGHGERATPAELDDLALEWIAIGPVEPTVHDALLARFERCRAAG
ncbi:MAG: DUF349 domain-containing protein [Proteobacteria bacterium]|nr:DUF349 domain-containing protein [Pseudomonadota bacterium]